MNAITRGGIEFIAVLFGLSISLWIDNTAKENELKIQNKKILNRLYHNLLADSTDGTWNYKAYERGIRGSENVIKWCDNNPTFASIDDSIEKDISAMMITTIFVHNEEEYIALKNSGRTDLITNEDLVIKLHDYYTRIGFIKTLDAFQNDFVKLRLFDVVLPFDNDTAQNACHEPVNFFEITNDIFSAKEVVHEFSRDYK